MKKNHIVDNILDTGLISPGNTVIVGVSGGPDSLCLLHALSGIADALDLNIVPVHINHKLREEADAEADHIDMICERLDLDCHIYEADCGEAARSEGISTEEAGREIRYEIFDEVAAGIEESGVRKDNIVIAVAHNADDQAETVLFRLIRGTGIHGLSGIPAVRLSEKGYLIARPLLYTERSEIEEYIRENRLRPNIDRTNSSNDYTRNRIRNELIPYIEKNYNPSIRRSLRNFAELAFSDDALLSDFALRDLSEYTEANEKDRSVILDISVVKDNPASINSRLVIEIMGILGISHRVTRENINAVVDLIYGSNPSASRDLPMGIRVRREYDRLIFGPEKSELLPDDSIRIYPQVLPARDFEPYEDIPYAAFDFDKFSAEYPGRLGDIVLRTRLEGDYLPIKGGNKKIQDLLVDSKVKKNARGSILMAAIDSEVLWVLPSEHFAGENEKTKGRFSQKFHIDDTTQRVLYIELEPAL